MLDFQISINLKFVTKSESNQIYHKLDIIVCLLNMTFENFA